MKQHMVNHLMDEWIFWWPSGRSRSPQTGPWQAVLCFSEKHPQLANEWYNFLSFQVQRQCFAWEHAWYYLDLLHAISIGFNFFLHWNKKICQLTMFLMIICDAVDASFWFIAEALCFKGFDPYLAIYAFTKYKIYIYSTYLCCILILLCTVMDYIQIFSNYRFYKVNSDVLSVMVLS
jgi:hypothetical protein